jgi:hypothetical protein
MVEVLDSLMGCDLGNLCAKVQWKICKWKLKMSTTLRANRQERDDTNVTNDNVFRSVCSAYLRTILVVCADMTHSPWENPAPIHLWGSYRLRKKILQSHTDVPFFFTFFIPNLILSRTRFFDPITILQLLHGTWKKKLIKL